MKKAIAKMMHEMKNRNSNYQVNSYSRHGDNKMDKMRMMMKTRNSNYQVNSYSRHGDNKMDKMRMMMKMMKMSNMMNDHSSSSYRSDDNDMYDMFSEMSTAPLTGWTTTGALTTA